MHASRQGEDCRIQRVLSENDWDALVCTLASNVLLLSGYWPVIGSAVAVFTREGAVMVVGSRRRKGELAEQGWADEVPTFESGSLSNLKTISESVGGRAQRNMRVLLGLHAGSVVGYEGSHYFDPSTYASTFRYGAGIQSVLGIAFPFVALADATTCLARLRSVLTHRELGLIRRACDISRQAFVTTSADIEAGMKELISLHCSGANCYRRGRRMNAAMVLHIACPVPNSAQAYAAFQQTSSEPLQKGISFCSTAIPTVAVSGPTSLERFRSGDPMLKKRQSRGCTGCTSKSDHAVRPGVRASAV